MRLLYVWENPVKLCKENVSMFKVRCECPEDLPMRVQTPAGSQILKMKVHLDWFIMLILFYLSLFCLAPDQPWLSRAVIKSILIITFLFFSFIGEVYLGLQSLKHFFCNPSLVHILCTHVFNRLLIRFLFICTYKCLVHYTHTQE